jgi:1,4-dihydroxy-2-naphthoate octaprenyltransferase
VNIRGLSTCALGLFLMSRPGQVVLIAMVYLFGALVAIAHGTGFHPEPFWLGLLALVLVSMSVHYSNEHADHQTDALTTRTLFSGGSGVIAEMGIPRPIALLAAWITLILGGGVSLMGVIIGWLSFESFLILGLGAVFGWMYSLPPLQLAWRGWGELDNALLGGVLLPLYGYVILAGRVTWEILLVFLPFAGLVFLNLLATTWPDRRADGCVGKETLATRWPASRLRKLYLIVFLGSLLLLLTFHGWLLPSVVVWSSLTVIPLAAWGWITYARIRNPFPTVAAMLLMLAAQMLAWWTVMSSGLG